MDKDNVNKYEITSFEDLMVKLEKEHEKNKFIMEKDIEEKIHNNISIIYNYETELGDNKEITNLFTKLSLILIDDLMIDIIKKLNDFLAKKYDINNYRLRDKREKEKYEEFISTLENNIKGSEDENIIKWITQEFLGKLEFIESTLLVDNEEKFLRLEKIISNSKKEIDEIESFIDEDEFVINIIQDFYDFKDKLYKNKFIGEINRIYKKLYKAISEKDTGWSINYNENKIKKELNINDKLIKEIITINKTNDEEEIDSNFEESKEIKKFISLPEGELK